MALKRVITLREALAINIGAIIGAGIFTISGLAAGIAGPSVILAILVGGIVSILTGLSFAELSHDNPKEGGNYEYARKILGNYAGFLTGIIFIVASIIGGAAVAISFGSYFVSLFGINLSVDVVAAALIIILSIVNYFGVKYSADLSVALTIIKIAVLAIFVLVGIFFIKPGNYVPFFPSGFGGLISSSAFIFFAYTGFARVTAIGEEVEDPKRTIPKAIIYSIIISAAIYALVMAVLIGIVPYSSIANSASPLEAAIQYATHNAILVYVISVGALFATINVDLSMILGISRVTFAISRDDGLPRVFKRVNRFGTPDMAIAFSGIIMLFAIFAINFKEIVSLSNSAALLSYTIANIAAIKLVSSRETGSGLFRSKYFIFLPIGGALSTLCLLAFLTGLSLIITLVLILLITAYYVIFVRNRN